MDFIGGNQNPLPQSARRIGKVSNERDQNPSPQQNPHPKLGTKCVEPLSSRNQNETKQKETRIFPTSLELHSLRFHRQKSYLSPCIYQ